MKNPFTKKEMQKKSFAEIFNIKQQEPKNKLPASNNFLEEKVNSLEAEIAAFKTAFAEIADAETNSIAKIRAIAKQCSDATVNK